MKFHLAPGPVFVGLFLSLAALAIGESVGGRTPRDDDELRYWLENMFVYHRFTLDEMADATGMEKRAVEAALDRLGIRRAQRLTRSIGAPLLVLPYPGGRHPRIGFLEGAINPQRETKISVFPPWSDHEYVVVDVPEAIWSNLGLTYLAHTHVPTVWTLAGVNLPPLEWNRGSDGTLDGTRELPNGIAFRARILPAPGEVQMDLWLTNGTRQTLTDLRVQNCVMLKGLSDFNQQTNDNKIFRRPYVICRNTPGTRWIITAWDPCHRPWANAPVPCLHSDPKFPDCPAGSTQRVRGWLSFYEGTNLDLELGRIEKTGWRR